jgi:hypothetical protein
MDPARHRWYLVGVTLTVAVVAVAWVFTLSQTISPELVRIRDGFVSVIGKAADGIKQIEVDK